MIFHIKRAGMAELADARDLKSRSRKGVRVRPPLPADKMNLLDEQVLFFACEMFSILLI